MNILGTAPVSPWLAYFNAIARNGESSYPMRAGDFPRGTFDNLMRPHTVVDVGCGYGRAVPVLKEVGIEGYLGIDAAEDQVALARQRYPAHDFDVCDMLEMGSRYPGRFDGFLLVSMFAFIPRARAVPALRSLAMSLKSGAVGVLTTSIGWQDIRTAHGMYFNYTPAEIGELVKDTGFRINDGYTIADKAIVLGLQLVA